MARHPGNLPQDLLSVWGFLTIVLRNALPGAWCKVFGEGDSEKAGIRLFNMKLGDSLMIRAQTLLVYSESVLPFIFTNKFFTLLYQVLLGSSNGSVAVSGLSDSLADVQRAGP